MIFLAQNTRNYEKLVSILLYIFALISFPAPFIAYFAFKKESKFIALHALFVAVIVLTEILAVFAFMFYLAVVPPHFNPFEVLQQTMIFLIFAVAIYVISTLYGIIVSILGKTPILMEKLSGKISLYCW